MQGIQFTLFGSTGRVCALTTSPSVHRFQNSQYIEIHKVRNHCQRFDRFLRKGQMVQAIGGTGGYTYAALLGSSANFYRIE